MAYNDSLSSNLARVAETVNRQTNSFLAISEGVAKSITSINHYSNTFSFTNRIAKSIKTPSLFDLSNKFNISYAPAGIDLKLLQAINSQNSILNNVTAFAKSFAISESIAQQANTISKATNWISKTLFIDALKLKKWDVINSAVPYYAAIADITEDINNLQQISNQHL